MVVAETPSLGRALFDALEGLCDCVIEVPDARAARAAWLRHRPDRRVVLVLAAQRWFSPTIRLWQRGALGDAPLVVLGTRDARLRTGDGLHLVGIPFDASEVLGLVRQLAFEKHSRTGSPTELALRATLASREGWSPALRAPPSS